MSRRATIFCVNSEGEEEEVTNYSSEDYENEVQVVLEAIPIGINYMAKLKRSDSIPKLTLEEMEAGLWVVKPR